MNPREELQEFLGRPVLQIGKGSLTIATVLFGALGGHRGSGNEDAGTV